MDKSGFRSDVVISLLCEDMINADGGDGGNFATASTVSRAT
jgi:hypothetical protein